MRQIFLDTETTGLSAEGGDRVIEIGCVELFNRKLTGNNLHFYLNPERDSHEDALKVHGISNEFLRDKPKFAQVAQEVLDYLRGAEIIIHNAAFDIDGGFNTTHLLFGTDAEQAVSVHRERHTNARRTSRHGRDAAQLKARQTAAVLHQIALTLQHVQGQSGLPIFVGGEVLCHGRGNGLVARDDTLDQTAHGLDAQ